MRIVVDTNVLVSALLSATSLPAQLVTLWRHDRFDLLISGEQLDELVRVTRYPKLRDRLSPPLAGPLINQLRDVAILVADLPDVTAIADPFDDHLLALAAAGKADFLVTGDKRDLLGLKAYRGTRIVTVRDFLILHRWLPR